MKKSNVSAKPPKSWNLGSMLVLLLTLSLSLNCCGKTEEDKVKGMDLPLNAKRALLEVAKDVYPETQKKVDELVGKHVPIVVDWESMSHYGENYTKASRYKSYGFDPIVEGIEAVAKDEAGKSALAAKLEKIELSGKHPDESSTSDNLSFKDGVLKTKQAFDGNGVWSGSRIKECLEEAL